jgi:hypothetical protein
MTANTAEAATVASGRRQRPGRRRSSSANAAASTHQPQPAPPMQPMQPESDSPWPETVANPRRIQVR